MSDAFDQAVCDILGMNRTDARCLDIIERRGQVTAGDLAEESGLTTGAVTALLDRLERAGTVRRIRDTTDRRRVLAELTTEGRSRSMEFYAPLAEGAAKLFATYSDEQLAFVRDFLRRGRQMTTEHLARVQAQAAEAKVRARVAKREVRDAKLAIKEAKSAVKGELKRTKLEVKQAVKRAVKPAPGR